MASEERRSFFALVRVELEEATAEEAAYFWEAIQGGGATIGREGMEAGIVSVEPEPEPTARDVTRIVTKEDFDADA